MQTLDDLSQAVHAYQTGEAPLADFEDWFRRASRNRFASPVAVRDVYDAVDMAFVRLDEAEISETEFREELANAIRPFAVSVSKSSALEVQELRPLLEAPPKKRSASEVRPVQLKYA